MNWQLFSHFQEVVVPVFVAMSPLTVLPVYLAMTDGLALHHMQVLSRKAILTAFTVAICITLAGQAIFRILGITVNDLRVGGGLILLIIAIYDLIFSREQRKKKEMQTDVGIVPLGTPLIVGPATMTACLVLADTHGRTLVVAALLVNVGITWFILHNAHVIKRYVSSSISRAFGKVMSLFLAAIAVGTMRVGITSFIEQATK